MSNIGTYAKAIVAFLGAGASAGAAMMSQGVPMSWRLGLSMLAAACVTGVTTAVVSNAPASGAGSKPPVSEGVVTTDSEVAPEVATMYVQADASGSSPVLARADTSVTPG